KENHGQRQAEPRTQRSGVSGTLTRLLRCAACAARTAVRVRLDSALGLIFFLAGIIRGEFTGMLALLPLGLKMVGGDHLSGPRTETLAQRLLLGKLPVSGWRPSINDWDGLGHGIYFWEHAPERALRWARERYRGRRQRPAVVGAHLQLGRCFDL